MVRCSKLQMLHLHPFSWASSVALARICALRDDGVEEEVSDSSMACYIETMRKSLCLDNGAMYYSIMIAQPLVYQWGWKCDLAYTVGVLLGAKVYFDESFYAADIVQHVSSCKYDILTLMAKEVEALKLFEWKIMLDATMFRNALISVALEYPAVADTTVWHAPNAKHVVMLDDCPFVNTMHKEMCRKQNIEPFIFDTAEDAIQHVRLMNHAVECMNLVVIDGTLKIRDEGFDVAAVIKTQMMHSKSAYATPLIVLLTGTDAIDRTQQNTDGSACAFDVLAQKPLTLHALSTYVLGGMP